MSFFFVGIFFYNFYIRSQLTFTSMLPRDNMVSQEQFLRMFKYIIILNIIINATLTLFPSPSHSLSHSLSLSLSLFLFVGYHIC